MSKILPVNINPYLRTYTHHGFLHCITSSKEKITLSENQLVADIHVTNFSQYKWEMQNDQLEYKVNKHEQLTFFANKWNLGMNIAFFRTAKPKDEIELSINYQLYSNAFSSISLFVTDSENMIDFDSYKFCLGNFSKDGIFYSNQKFLHNRFDIEPADNTSLKLIIDGNCIFVEYRNDKICSNSRLLIGQLDKQIENYKIGFTVNLRNNIYYESLFSNYIQLVYKFNQAYTLDFICNPPKDWVLNTFNYLVDYYNYYEKNINELGFTLLEFIKKQIDINSYIEIELNDNIHFGKSDENGKFFHQNLIYGYNDEEQYLYSIYYHIGRTYYCKIPYSTFESERNERNNRIFYCLKYNPSYDEIKIDPKRLLQLYTEYQDGKNISYYYPRYQSDCIFGLDCLKYLATEEGINTLCSDIRVSHLLYEHAVCNKDRMLYLSSKKLISKEQCENLVSILDNEIDQLCVIQNKIMKSSFGRPFKKDKMLEYSKAVLELDECFTEEVIKTLECNCDK